MSRCLHVATGEGIARLTLDHPPVNILTRDVLAELRDTCATLAADPALRVLLLDAAGRHFSAGADVGEHLPPAYEELIPEFLDTVRQLDAFPVPTVFAVQGRCLGGGCELALAADFLLAADTAQFGQPEIVLGVFPPVACAWLPARVPRGVAAQLVFSGDPLSAEEALRAGLVHRVVPAQALRETADQLARRLARHSAAALRAAKRALRAGRTEAPAAALAAAGAVYVDDLMATRDAAEGLRAFLEKREPAWGHR